MKNLRYALTLLAALTASVALAQTQISTLYISIRELTFTVYPDGVVHVTIKLYVNETYPAFSIRVIGAPAMDLLVTDSSGAPLNFDLDDGNLTVYSLGASEVYVEYETLNLTYKEGVLWSFAANSSVSFYVILPWNATVVGLSDAPLSVSTLQDGRIMLEMPEGPQNVSYIIPPSVTDLRYEALTAISKAQEAILKAKSEGRLEGLEDAEKLLMKAKDFYEQGDYLEAKQRALEAYDTAGKAKQPLTQTLASYAIWILGIAGFIGMITAVVLRHRRKRIERVFREHPWLDEDEKNVLKVLWIKGGAAFESDIRESLGLPKTTVWRIVKKLESEGLVEIEKVQGRNYVRLRA
ncbi:winged helix-turn-helix transcriptional regulator [Candidatus Bathyarchaeota archaeon]|nr:winged helix-turn-helix transcriptional regulator [Candidatus Bathyarchaeota archaeon]